MMVSDIIVGAKIFFSQPKKSVASLVVVSLMIIRNSHHFLELAPIQHEPYRLLHMMKVSSHGTPMLRKSYEEYSMDHNIFP